MPMTEEEARKRLEDEKGFYIHLVTYVSVITGLAILNILTGTDHFWFLYPMIGWGFGLTGHATQVFGMPGRGKDWEERRLHELTGGESEQARAESLRRLLDEELDERSLPESSEYLSVERMQRRIEHLEAIVTSQDWDEVHDSGRLLDEGGAEKRPENAEERAHRLSGRVR